VGAQCVNCARWDLCGGRSVMGVPTAIMSNIAGRQARYAAISNLMP